MGTFPSLSRSERAPHKITTAVVRAQDQFLSTVDAVVTSPDLPTPSGGLIAGAATRRLWGALIVAWAGRRADRRATSGPLRGLVRGRHRAPAIELHYLEQAAMLLSPKSALERITDSSQTSRQVRKGPT